MPNTSIFAEEWRDCLRAHYTYVVRMNDKGTERSLHGVMIEAGFTEADVRELYVMATAHVDHVGADFVPDMEVLEAETFTVAAVAMPQEVIEAALVEDSLALDEAAAATEIDEREIDESDEEEPPPPPDPDITQLSLF